MINVFSQPDFPYSIQINTLTCNFVLTRTSGKRFFNEILFFYMCIYLFSSGQTIIELEIRSTMRV